MNPKSLNSPSVSLPVVILAAGQGHRLRPGNGDVLKPLTPLLGLTLLERALLSAREVGSTDFLVVTGSCQETIWPHILELEHRHGLSIQVIENLDWEAGNGGSVLAAAPYVTGPFLLLMCDHLFDPDILRRLIKTEGGSAACYLAVDHRTDQVFDLKDATKVQLDGQYLTAIGKELATFDAVDTGLFHCQPALFDALAQARRDGDGTLSGGLRRLIQTRQAQAADIGERFWLDVDTPEALGHARQRLLASRSKPAEDGFVSHYLNRRLSRGLTRLLLHTPLSPNGITLLSFLIGLIGAGFFSLGEYSWTLLGGFLTQFASIVDGCDGEVARLKFQCSRFGAWFDTILDRYADVAVALGISLGYWRTHPFGAVWLGGALALTGFLLISYTKKEYRLRYRRQPPTGVLARLTKRDMRLLVLFLGALLNRPFVALLLVGLLSHLGIGWLFFSEYRLENTTPST